MDTNTRHLKDASNFIVERSLQLLEKAHAEALDFEHVKVVKQAPASIFPQPKNIGLPEFTRQASPWFGASPIRRPEISIVQAPRDFDIRKDAAPGIIVRLLDNKLSQNTDVRKFDVPPSMAR